MSKKKGSPAPTVSVHDIPLMPYEKAGETSADANESSLSNLVDSLLGEQPANDEPPVEETEAEAEEVLEEEEVEEIAAEAESDEEAEAEAVTEESDEPVLEIEGERITQTELKKRMLLQADYTRKTQEIAEQRKAAEAEKTAYATKRDEFASMLDQVVKALEQPTPDFARIREDEGEAAYAAAVADWQMNQQQIAAVKAKQAEIEAEQASEKTAAFEAYKREQKEKLLTLVPEWQDEATAREEVGRIVNFAKTTYGYTDDDVSSAYDARIWVLLRDAAKYHELKATGTKKIAAVPAAKVLKPGARQVNANPAKIKARKEQEAKLKNLRRTGRMNDAVAAIESLLG